MRRPAPKVHPFISDDGHYCSHVFGTKGTCNRPEANPVHDVSKAPIPAESFYELPDDKGLVDRGIRRCLESGMTEFSSNDLQDELGRVQNRKMPGLRFQAWCKSRVIVKVGRTVPSTNPAAKGHEVQVYAPGPNYRRLGEAS